MSARCECSNKTYFCFRAEGGMRDIGVTGVQTCALPMSLSGDPDLARPRRRAGGGDHHLQPAPAHPRHARRAEDRKSVVSGKSVDLGGRRISKKKKKSCAYNLCTTARTLPVPHDRCPQYI